jgi:NAD(P)-dependent dehydrogenase (short-subunit alcohol dehydrogenase family)
MTQCMAREWLRYGINVNAICPGYRRTEMTSDVFDGPLADKLMRMLPRERLGAVNDLDGLVLLLASDASSFINGAIIPADDGMLVN